MDRRGFLASAAATSVFSGASSARAHAHAHAHAQERGEDIQSGGPDAFTFPPEWDRHEAVWIGWDDAIFDDADHTRLRLDMLAAITPYVPVTVNTGSEANAARIAALMVDAPIEADRVSFNIQDTVDWWVRDTGPLFISNRKRLGLAAFKWGNYGFPWPYTGPAQMNRIKAPQQIAASRGYRQRTSDVVAEGGGIEVNSRSLITYRDAALHRNPGKTLEEIEAELKRLYGKEQVIWLERAPITDRIFTGPKVANFYGWGANGHVDEYVRFVSEDTILVAQVGEEERGRDALMRLDHEILAENRRQLEEARDPDGKPFKVVPMPVPDVAVFQRARKLTKEDFSPAPNGFDQRSVYRGLKVGDDIIDVPAVSYLNFLITNGVVVGAKYWEEGMPEHIRQTDEQSATILKEHFPGRNIVQINPLAANWFGGGVHCLTQQQPAVGV